MIALLFTFLAATCAALSNLVFRKNNGHAKSHGKPYFYLVCFYFFSFAFSFILYPSIWKSSFNFVTFGIGSCVGVLNVALMLLTARALQKGPAGLTFAFQNASAIFPGMLLFLAFGTDFGFSFSYFQLAGIILVLFGLFLGAKNSAGDSNKSIFLWLKYALACFLVQVFALTLIQGRCILFDSDQLGDFFARLSLNESDDAWFMPGLFGTAFVLLTFLFLREKNSKPQMHEGMYGLFGGLANFGSTFLLLLATKSALPLQKIILFPSFAATTIILCNLWANRLYKEKFNFRTNLLCALGIFMGALK